MLQLQRRRVCGMNMTTRGRNSLAQGDCSGTDPWTRRNTIRTITHASYFDFRS